MKNHTRISSSCQYLHFHIGTLSQDFNHFPCLKKHLQCALIIIKSFKAYVFTSFFLYKALKICLYYKNVVRVNNKNRYLKKSKKFVKIQLLLERDIVSASVSGGRFLVATTTATATTPTLCRSAHSNGVCCLLPG